MKTDAAATGATNPLATGGRTAVAVLERPRRERPWRLGLTLPLATGATPVLIPAIGATGTTALAPRR